MEMKYYNPSNNFRAPIPRVPREPKPYMPPRQAPEESGFHLPAPQISEEKESKPAECPKPLMNQKKAGIFGALSQDDMLILGIIFLLLLNSCDDYLLLLALGYLFISGRENK